MPSPPVFPIKSIAVSTAMRYTRAIRFTDMYGDGNPGMHFVEMQMVGKI